MGSEAQTWLWLLWGSLKLLSNLRGFSCSRSAPTSKWDMALLFGDSVKPLDFALGMYGAPCHRIIPRLCNFLKFCSCRISYGNLCAPWKQSIKRKLCFTCSPQSALEASAGISFQHTET